MTDDGHKEQNHHQDNTANDEQDTTVGADAVDNTEDQEETLVEGHSESAGAGDHQVSGQISRKKEKKRRRSRHGTSAYDPAMDIMGNIASDFIARQNADFMNSSASMGIHEHMIKQWGLGARALDLHEIAHPEIYSAMIVNQPVVEMAQGLVSKTWDDTGIKIAQTALAGGWDNSSVVAGIRAAGIGPTIPVVETEVLNIVRGASISALKDHGLGGIGVKLFEDSMKIPGVAEMYTNAAVDYLQKLGGKNAVDTGIWNVIKGVNVDGVASQAVIGMAAELTTKVESAAFSNLQSVISGAMKTASIDAWESAAGIAGVGAFEKIVEGLDEFEDLKEFSEIRDWFNDDGPGLSVDVDEEDIAQQVEEELREKFSTAEPQVDDALYWQRLYQESVARETQLVTTNKGLVELANHVTARIESLEKRLEALEQQDKPTRLKQTLEGLLVTYKIVREVVIVIGLPVLTLWFTVVDPVENQAPQTVIEEYNHQKHDHTTIVMESPEDVPPDGAPVEPVGAPAGGNDHLDDGREDSPVDVPPEGEVERLEDAPDGLWEQD